MVRGAAVAVAAWEAVATAAAEWAAVGVAAAAWAPAEMAGNCRMHPLVPQ